MIRLQEDVISADSTATGGGNARTLCRDNDLGVRLCTILQEIVILLLNKSFKIILLYE